VKTALVWLSIAGFGVLSSGSSIDVSGVWTLTFQPDRANRDLSAAPPSSDCALVQQGAKLTGRCGVDEVPVMGEVNGQHVTVQIKSDATAVLSAAIDSKGTRLAGTWQVRSSFGRFIGTKHQP
jgi:hypothetical protein